MEENIKKLKYMLTFSISLAVLAAYFSIIFGQQKGRIYFSGLGLVPVILCLAYVFYRKLNAAKAIFYIKQYWGSTVDRKRDFTAIKKYFQLHEEMKEYENSIDDQSWQDLNMDDIFKLLDRTHSNTFYKRRSNFVFYIILCF